MKYLHTMIRVGNLERSIAFYTNVIGLKLVKQKEYPEGKFTLAFLGISENEEPFLELTYNWGVESYDLGKGYGHIALGVADIYGVCDKITTLGGSVVRAPGPMKGSTSTIAFVADPDGYRIELIERANS